MDRLRFRKRLLGWIACFAMLLNALAPSVSHAVAAGSGLPPWLTDFCTADGGVPSPLPSALPSSGGAPQLHLDHCPYCLTHAGSFALPTGCADAFAAAASGTGMPRPLLPAPHSPHAWTALLPRAPPPAF